MAPRFAFFLAVNLLISSAVVHGCKPTCPPPITPTPPVIPTPPVTPTAPGTPSTPPVTPTPPGTPTPPSGGNNGTCPINTLKLAVCANVLNLLRLNIAVPKDEQCCPLLQGLVDLDAALCLCLAIRANILGIVLNLPVDLTLLLNFCHKDRIAGFTCPT